MKVATKHLAFSRLPHYAYTLQPVTLSFSGAVLPGTTLCDCDCGSVLPVSDSLLRLPQVQATSPIAFRQCCCRSEYLIAELHVQALVFNSQAARAYYLDCISHRLHGGSVDACDTA